MRRFRRAAYFRALLPAPANERQAIAGVLAIMRNVSVPFGAPYKGCGIYDTEYRTVADLTNLRAPGAAVPALDPDAVGRSGDVTGRLRKAHAPC